MRLPDEKMLPPDIVRPLDEESPADERAPERIVDVPDVVLRRDPPLRVRPFDDESPPAVMPPANVLVALTVETRDPPAIVRPPVDTRRSDTARPPVNEEVAVEVLRIEDELPVMARPPEVESPAADNPPRKVEVALVLLILSTSPPIVPAMERSAYGEVVPTPTKPLLVIRNAVEVARVWVVVVEIMNTGAVEVPVSARVALGDDEPIPRLPDWVRIRSVEVALLFADVVVEAMVKSGRVAGKEFAPKDRSPHGDEVPMPSSPLVVFRERKFADERAVAPE